MAMRDIYHKNIPFDRGRPLTPTISVMTCRGLSIGPGSPRPWVFYGTRNGDTVPGYYATEEAFLYAATHLSAKVITEHLARIYDPRGASRPVRMHDLEALANRIGTPTPTP